MGSKPEKAKPQRVASDSGGILGGVPLGSVMDVFDGISSFLFSVFKQRYRVDERIEQIKEDAQRKVEEIREEAIRTGYAIKKAFFSAIVEAIFLSTGLLALVIGTIMVVSDYVPMKYVLVGYGALVVIIILIRFRSANQRIARHDA
jgi:hypothetical protein